MNKPVTIWGMKNPVRKNNNELSGISVRRIILHMRKSIENIAKRTGTIKDFSNEIENMLKRIIPDPEVEIEVEDCPSDGDDLVYSLCGIKKDQDKQFVRIRVKNAPDEWIEALRMAGIFV